LFTFNYHENEIVGAGISTVEGSALHFRFRVAMIDIVILQAIPCDLQ
jgi:hypothetical protein